VGEATHAVMIRPGEEILAVNGGFPSGISEVGEAGIEPSRVKRKPRSPMVAA
jgi:hypothetical protein